MTSMKCAIPTASPMVRYGLNNALSYAYYFCFVTNGAKLLFLTKIFCGSGERGTGWETLALLKHLALYFSPKVIKKFYAQLI